MLHLRLRVPDDCVDAVLDCLRDDGTVTNVAIVPGAYIKPAGALVLADVARESASSVISALRELDLHHDGAVAMEYIDTVMSDDAARAVAEAPGDPDDGVVWEMVENRLRRDSAPSLNAAAFMLVAVLIASIGRILDETVLIVAAMVVGPDFSAIAATAFAIARRRWTMLRITVPAMLLRFLGSAAAASAIWAVAYQFGVFTQRQAGTGSATDFIVNPDAWSFAVAVLAGIVGVLSLTTSSSGPLVGVFISVTTVPAVGAFAICVASGLWAQAGSAALQLGINLAGILVAGVVTLVLQQVVWTRLSHGFALRGSGLARRI